MFLVTNEALIPPSNNKTVKSEKAFWMKAERRTKKWTEPADDVRRLALAMYNRSVNQNNCITS